MRVKLFTKRGDLLQLEEEINRWLSDKNVSMSHSHIKQNYIYDGKDHMPCALISVWYDPDFEK